MRSRYRVVAPHSSQFVTSTIVEWLPVFTTRTRCHILADSLAFCQAKKGLQIYAWVILDNHFHAILAAPDLTQVVADLKRHTAKLLLKSIESDGQEWLLNQLAYYRAKDKQQSLYQVWQEGFHPQAILDDAMMQQKLDYIHANPVKRGLVALPEHWRYSSAHEWLSGVMPIFRCDPWR